MDSMLLHPTHAPRELCDLLVLIIKADPRPGPAQAAVDHIKAWIFSLALARIQDHNKLSSELSSLKGDLAALQATAPPSVDNPRLPLAAASLVGFGLLTACSLLVWHVLSPGALPAPLLAAALTPAGLGISALLWSDAQRKDRNPAWAFQAAALGCSLLLPLAVVGLGLAAGPLRLLSPFALLLVLLGGGSYALGRLARFFSGFSSSVNARLAFTNRQSAIKTCQKKIRDLEERLLASPSPGEIQLTALAIASELDVTKDMALAYYGKLRSSPVFPPLPSLSPS
jgi:hypothetical protein